MIMVEKEQRERNIITQTANMSNESSNKATDFTAIKKTRGQALWRTPIIPVAQEAEARGSQVQSQPHQLSKTLSQNKT